MRLGIGTFTFGLCLALTAACTKDAETATAGAPVMQSEDSAAAPTGAKAGSCYAADRTPARLETVTEQVLVSAEVKDGAGKVTKPASYRTETRQKMTAGGESLLFETPCKAQMTPELISNLQRALAARGLYSGKNDGVMGPQLRQAIRLYQAAAHDKDSAILSMEAARSLGLIAYDRADF